MHESTRFNVDRVMGPQGPLAAGDPAMVMTSGATVGRKPKLVATVISAVVPLDEALPSTDDVLGLHLPDMSPKPLQPGSAPVSDQEQ
jgi:hypothetical protein